MDLQSYTFAVVDVLSALTILGQVIATVLVASLLFKRERLIGWTGRNALWLMLVVSLTATLGSLFFSDIAQWTPCKDCWWQRIFMYPQVALLIIALWKKDRNIAPYILALCLFGMLIAADHYSDQVQAAFFPVPDAEGVNILLKPCDASGVSCAKTQIHFTFGYITIPMMAFTAFLLNAIGSVCIMRFKK
jgi:disulfide bond formation protein DsbB